MQISRCEAWLALVNLHARGMHESKVYRQRDTSNLVHLVNPIRPAGQPSADHRPAEFQIRGSIYGMHHTHYIDDAQILGVWNGVVIGQRTCEYPTSGIRYFRWVFCSSSNAQTRGQHTIVLKMYMYVSPVLSAQCTVFYLTLQMFFLWFSYVSVWSF